MQSLTELNGYASTGLEVTDNRPATVVWDRTVFMDQKIEIETTSVTIPVARDVVEIINYSTANLRYSLAITNVGSPSLGDSNLIWNTLPSGVTVTESPADTYTVTGIKSQSDWNQIKNPIWILPSDYSSAQLWFVRVTITYYDETIGADISFTYDVYDDDHYYNSKFTSVSSLLCGIKKTVSPSVAMSVSSSVLAEVDVPMIMNSSLTLVPSTIKRISQSLQVQSSITATATLDFTLVVSVFSSRTISLDLYGRVSTNIKVDWGDGNNDTYTATNNTATHTYASNGEYTITIRGKFNKFRHTASTPTWTKRVLSWGFTNIQDFSEAFYSTGGPLQLLELPNYLLSTTTNISGMCRNQINFNSSNISTWNTVNITNMSRLFQGCAALNQPVGSWNTGNVTNMQYLFNSCTSFNQPLNSWNTSKVTNMLGLFENAQVFNQPLNSWNTGNVIDMSYMFYNAYLFNQPIGSWNTSKVTAFNMNYMFHMDLAIGAFDQNISSWCVFNIKNKPTGFDDGTLSSWTTAEKPNWGAPC